MMIYNLYLIDDDTTLKSFDAENDDEAIAIARELFDRRGDFEFQLWEISLSGCLTGDGGLIDTGGYRLVRWEIAQQVT
jgi:hypothetical protein